jgi:hypothetical protein
VIVVCDWFAIKAATFAGPWSKPVGINVAGTSTVPGVNRVWEDPYIYQDKRGYWHLLAHTYTTAPFASTKINYVSGHGFSHDGLSWNISRIEPYSYLVNYTDAAPAPVATRERPKFMFDEVTGEPSQLITAVSAQWPCTPCPHGGACIDCKVQPPFDKDVFTMIQPLRQTAAAVQHE